METLIENENKITHTQSYLSGKMNFHDGIRTSAMTCDIFITNPLCRLRVFVSLSRIKEPKYLI